MFVVLTNIPTPYRTNFFCQLSASLEHAGDSLHVLYCAATEPNRQWEFVPSDNKYQHTIMKGIHPDFGSFYPHLNPSIVTHLRNLKPTKVLIAGAWNTPTMVMALAYLRIRKIKTIFWSEAHADSVKRTKGIVAFLRTHIFNSFSAFAVPNAKSRDYITEHLGIRDKPIFFLPNTVNDRLFTKSLNTPVINKGQSVKRKLVQVSQLEDRKGVKELITAWLNIDRQKRKDWVLVIAGDGPLRAELTLLLTLSDESETVQLTGHLTTQGVLQLLHSASAFVLATKNDPNPLSVIEAAFAGLPLLISRMAGNAQDLVLPGKNGYLINEIIADTIAETISEFLEMEHAEQAAMGLVSLELANAKFRCTEVVDNFLTQVKEGL